MAVTNAAAFILKDTGVLTTSFVLKVEGLLKSVHEIKWKTREETEVISFGLKGAEYSFLKITVVVLFTDLLYFCSFLDITVLLEKVLVYYLFIFGIWSSI
ncbi:hypothetical protein KFK09_016999 [Dendrobium nobile]|uniref:Uncharacterized protein n=1 Tax=Dendrobium nobile TaxID=94219 RepID=A0A8T3B1B3_DENNO|nr:hypothetical protein KFK09_016999 [Dendrobium nobile]